MVYMPDHVCLLCLQGPMGVHDPDELICTGDVSLCPAWVGPCMEESGLKDKVLKRRTELSMPEQLNTTTKPSMQWMSQASLSEPPGQLAAIVLKCSVVPQTSSKHWSWPVSGVRAFIWPEPSPQSRVIHLIHAADTSSTLSTPASVEELSEKGVKSSDPTHFQIV